MTNTRWAFWVIWAIVFQLPQYIRITYMVIILISLLNNKPLPRTPSFLCDPRIRAIYLWVISPLFTAQQIAHLFAQQVRAFFRINSRSMQINLWITLRGLANALLLIHLRASISEGANKMNEQELINAVRDHALDNYTVDGWDYLVECWADGDILECIDDATTVAQAIANVRDALAPLAERRDEVRAASGEY